MPIQSQELVKLDLNNPVFQKHLFGLQKKEQSAVLGTLRKISKMTWQQVYEDNGGTVVLGRGLDLAGDKIKLFVDLFHHLGP